jgi:hypothetical protein
MSGPAASVRKRETRARRESIESLSADKKIARRERKAAWNRKDRAEKKVEQSLVADEIARLQAALTRKDRRIAALTQLLDCIDEQARGDSDADHEPDQADESPSLTGAHAQCENRLVSFEDTAHSDTHRPTTDTLCILDIFFFWTRNARKLLNDSIERTHSRA